MTNHQRAGSPSNAHAGRLFELEVKAYFEREEGLILTPNLPINIGVSTSKPKAHRFDLGSHEPAVLIECKSHNWTITGNMPSAKMTVWNEAMYYFHLAPAHYRKILVVLDSSHEKKSESLAAYYARINAHLIPDSVSIIELNPNQKSARYVKRIVSA